MCVRMCGWVRLRITYDSVECEQLPQIAQSGDILNVAIYNVYCLWNGLR